MFPDAEYTFPIGKHTFSIAEHIFTIGKHKFYGSENGTVQGSPFLSFPLRGNQAGDCGAIVSDGNEKKRNFAS